MNTETTQDGIEVYLHQFYQLADEYVEKQLDGNEKLLEKRFRDFYYRLMNWRITSA